MKNNINIILITIDALRCDCLGCYGSPLRTSPNIDSLAERSLLLENTYSPSFGTDPIHTSIFTGLLPYSHGILHHGSLVTKEEAENFLLVKDQFLPNVLKAHGYQTLAVDFLGRWHRTGFDYYSGALGNIMDKGRNQIYERVIKTRLGQKLFPYTILKFLLGRIPAHDSAERIVLHAKEKIDKTRKPFFLFFHFWDTHTPYDPPAKYCRRFKNICTQHNQKIDVLLNNAIDARWKTYMRRCTYGAKYTDEIVRRYLGSIRYVDDQIGNLLSYFESNELLDNTLIIITADHGEHLGEHGTYFVHHTLFNEILRVPLIIRFPDEKRGRVKGACQLIDILPTILDFLNIEKDFDLDGSSVMALMEGEDSQELRDRNIFFGQTGSGVGTGNRNGIIKEKYKYILGSEEVRKCQKCGLVHHEREELYDLESDPREMDNLAEKEKQKTQELRTILLDFLESSRYKIGKSRIKAKIKGLKTSGEI